MDGNIELGSAPPPWKTLASNDFVPLPAYGNIDDSVGGGAPFENHDCRGISHPIVDWDRLRDSLKSECEHTRDARTLRCAAKLVSWQGLIGHFLRLEQPQKQDADPLDFDAFERVQATARNQCRLGTLFLNAARVVFCAMARRPSCYTKLTTNVSKELFATPLTVIMGTDWPIYALLNSYDWAWPGTPKGSDYECIRPNATAEVVDWHGLRRSFVENPIRPTTSWWSDSLKFVFNRDLVLDFHRASRECLYGVYVLNMVKAMWGADTESSIYYVYAPYVQWILYESLHLIGSGGWPLFALLHHFTSLRRHGFQLDFKAIELGGLPYREHGEWLQEQSLQRHVELITASGVWRNQFVQAAEALRRALSHCSARSRLVYVTMVYGRFNQYISGWARRLRTISLPNLVMMTLDGEAHSLCGQHHPGRCVQGNINVLNKYTLLLIALQVGIDVVWLDFDIFLIRNPSDAIHKATEGFDLVMGYDYMSDCICNGFFFLRSRPLVHSWLFEMVRWLYDHPYEHDQRAISAFLNYTEKIAAKSEDLPQQPRWFVFDVNNAFINFDSWEGKFDELQFIHFVDGSAFSLYGRKGWDPSIPATQRRVALDEGDGSDQTAMDLFYQPEPITTDPESFWSDLPDLRKLMEMRSKPRPLKKQKCGILPHVQSAHPGYGWLIEAGV